MHVVSSDIIFDKSAELTTKTRPSAATHLVLDKATGAYLPFSRFLAAAAVYIYPVVTCWPSSRGIRGIAQFSFLYLLVLTLLFTAAAFLGFFGVF